MFRSYKKQIIISFLTGFLLSTTFVGSWHIIYSQTIRQANEAKVFSDTPAHVAPLDPGQEIKTLGIVLLGYGGAGHDGGYLTDAIQVLYVNFDQAIITLISIPRDLWVKLPGGGEGKINSVLVSTAGDKENLVQSGAPGIKTIISQITGLPINYFIGVDFVGFQRAIGETLDGIEVDVSETLNDPWYPIKGEELNLCGKSAEEIKEIHEKYSGFELERQFECRYKQIHYEKGIHHMEGGEALEYVRSRHGSAEGDVSRGKRQQEMLKAIQKKLFSLNALDDIPRFFAEMVKHIQTDIDLEIAEYLGPALTKAKDYTLVTINLSPTNVLVIGKSANGASMMMPKDGMYEWQGIHQFIEEHIDQAQ